MKLYMTLQKVISFNANAWSVDHVFLLTLECVLSEHLEFLQQHNEHE